MVGWRSRGLWLFGGCLELLLFVHLAEFLYPDYSVSQNYISDLGVGPMPSRAIFTGAVILFGLIALLTAYVMRDQNPESRIWLALALSGIGAVGVGVFNENSIPEVHAIFALMAFLFGNIAAICTFRLVRAPLSWLFVLSGIIGLAALALFGGGIYLGLGPGGMERMVFYPVMFWGLGYGAYLMEVDGKAVST